MESLTPPYGLGSPRYEDRRGSERRGAHYLRLFSPIPAVVLDLSKRGLALESMVGMRTRREYRLRIRHRGRVFTFAGKALWCQPNRVIQYSAERSVSLYRVGIELSSELSDSDFEHLSHIGGHLRQVSATP